jgi:hypothetical protein
MRARKSAAARPRIQDFPGHSEAAQTSMSEQARFPKSQSSPLLPSFSLPVELTRRQRHMQEHRCTQAVHKFSRCIPNPSQLFIVPGDQESQSRYGCGFRRCRTCCLRRVGKMGQRVGARPDMQAMSFKPFFFRTSMSLGAISTTIHLCRPSTAFWLPDFKVMCAEHVCLNQKSLHDNSLNGCQGMLPTAEGLCDRKGPANKSNKNRRLDISNRRQMAHEWKLTCSKILRSRSRITRRMLGNQ